MQPHTRPDMRLIYRNANETKQHFTLFYVYVTVHL